MSFVFFPSSDVRHAVIDGILFVTIDRPEKRNALSLGVLERIRDIFTQAASDSGINAAVVTGAGTKAFASGGDLVELAGYRGREAAEAVSLHGKAALDAIRRFPVPVIARLQGVALGGGAELALACDLRYASTSARLGYIHGRLRISPAWGGGGDLVRIVGPAKALRLMATTEILDANEGRALGVIDLVCPREESFDDWFEQRLEELRDQPRQVMCAYKAITGASPTPERTARDTLEREWFCNLWCHQDHWDALRKLEEGAP